MPNPLRPGTTSEQIERSRADARVEMSSFPPPVTEQAQYVGSRVPAPSTPDVEPGFGTAWAHFWSAAQRIGKVVTVMLALWGTFTTFVGAVLLYLLTQLGFLRDEALKPIRESLHRIELNQDIEAFTRKNMQGELLTLQDQTQKNGDDIAMLASPKDKRKKAPVQ